MDVLATVVGPLGQLLSWRWRGWSNTSSRYPTRRTGWPVTRNQITAYAGTWTSVAAAMRAAPADLDTAVRGDLAGWQSPDGGAYRNHVAQRQSTLAAVGAGARAMSTITCGTGLVVALVREIVRDLIAEFVSVLAVRLWRWLAIAGGTLGAGLPWVAAQVSSLAAKWAAKIARLLTGLIASLRRLAPMLTRLRAKSSWTIHGIRRSPT